MSKSKHYFNFSEMQAKMKYSNVFKSEKFLNYQCIESKIETHFTTIILYIALDTWLKI